MGAIRTPDCNWFDVPVFAIFLHEIQTGHTIFFGGSLIFMGIVISDSRNQAGAERFAIMEGDSRSLMILIVFGHVGSMLLRFRSSRQRFSRRIPYPNLVED